MNSGWDCSEANGKHAKSNTAGAVNNVEYEKENNEMTIGAFLIARLSSSRLPQKNIMPIAGKPMILQLAERVARAGCIDKVIVTTSQDPTDDPLEAVARDGSVECFRGPLDNIMERIVGAARAHKCNTIVELLGDNPLVHCDLIDEVVEFYRDGGYDYAANVSRDYAVSEAEMKLFSIGVRIQVYSRAAAEQHMAYRDYIANDERHPCAYIFDHPDIFKVGYVEAKGRWAFMNRPELTWAVNYPKNFELVRTIFEAQYPADINFPLKNVYRQLEQQPELALLMGGE